MPQQFTSWEAIYTTLRAAFPGAHYHTGASILSFENTANGIDIELSGKARRSVDLVVCADGAQSETRRRLLPEVMPRYAGYIAWRGSLPEADVPDHLASFFDDKFSFSDARSGGHILVYLIPGANADTTAGKRLLNWVWYVHASEAELPELLTDKDGRRHHSSLPQGGATEAAVAALRDYARREIHPRMAELVVSTPDPFIQTIVDVVVPRACSAGPASSGTRLSSSGRTRRELPQKRRAIPCFSRKLSSKRKGAFRRRSRPSSRRKYITASRCTATVSLLGTDGHDRRHAYDSA